MPAYPQPTEVNGMEIPDQLEVTHGRGRGALAEQVGLFFVKLTPDHSIAVLPVDGNTQPMGLLHGGMYCVVGEALGSMSANVHAGEDGYAVGVDINATHTASATSGWVTGECRAVHLGRSITVHEIVITNDEGKRCSTVRITNMIRKRR